MTVETGIALNLLHDTKAEARWAEELGFDYLCTGEHVMFHGPTPNTLVSLAAAAGATERIKLASSIALVPLYPAALLAKQAAILDVVSGGRFTLGVGIGGEYPKEFEAVGVPVAERAARTDEALAVLDQLLRGGEVTFDGRFTKLDGVAIAPRPVQEPRLPFWVAGRKDGAMRRAARYGDAWLPYMYTPEMLAGSVAKVAAFAAEEGRDPGSILTGLYIFACVHEDRATALDLANKQLSRQYNQDFSKLVGKYTISGTPDDCIERLTRYVGAGARTVVFGQGCPRHYVERNTTLLAEQVIPALAARSPSFRP
jgi:probable F420-dependent oxidoreductase